MNVNNPALTKIKKSQPWFRLVNNISETTFLSAEF